MSTNSEMVKLMSTLERFCAYQERCHQEVIQKMRGMAIDSDTRDTILCHLIESNFLNEERFACSFARGKHRIKNWGKIRIINELKARNITETNIKTALQEIAPAEYVTTFENLAGRVWENTIEKNVLKKRKKFCDYLLRKGFESQIVYEKVKELEKSKD